LWIICLVLEFHLATLKLFASASQHKTVVFYGAVIDGKQFEHKFGKMIFKIEPQDKGFFVSIWDASKSFNDAHGDLSWFTPPLHGLTDRDILATDFRNEENSGPQNGPRPQFDRRIYFSKNAAAMLERFDAARGTDSPYADLRMDEGICNFHITRMDFQDLRTGHQPKIKRMNFRVKLCYLP
jgi:hypothetical protein